MTTIKLRRGKAAQWATANPVLALGEPGYVTDTGLLKVGDGETPFGTLPGFLDEGVLRDTFASLNEAGELVVGGNLVDVPGSTGPRSGMTVAAPKRSSGLVTDTSSGFTNWYGQGVVGHTLTEKKAGKGSVVMTVKPNDTGQSMMLKELGSRDLSHQTFKLWVKCTDWTATAQVRLHTTHNNDFFYLSVKDAFASTEWVNNEWMELSLPRSAFGVQGAPAWDNINMVSFLGWSRVDTTPTIWFNHLTAHPDGVAGKVSITFDDGYASNYSAATIMDEFGYVGNTFIIPELLGTSGYLTQAQVEDLHDRGWLIGGHGATNLATLPAAEAEAAVSRSYEYLARHGYRGSEHFAYPNGGNNDQVRGIVRRYFSSGRTINPNGNGQGYLNEFRINAVSVYGTQDDRQVTDLVDAAVANREWFILCFHKINDDTDQVAWTETRFRTLLTYLKNSGVSVAPMFTEALA